MGNPSSSPFLNSVREAIRVRDYSLRTEEAYVNWVKRFVLLHGKRHPKEMYKAVLNRPFTNRNDAVPAEG